MTFKMVFGRCNISEFRERISNDFPKEKLIPVVKALEDLAAETAGQGLVDPENAESADK